MLTARMPLPVEISDIADAVWLLRLALVSSLENDESDCRTRHKVFDECAGTRSKPEVQCDRALLSCDHFGLSRRRGPSQQLGPAPYRAQAAALAGVAFGFRRSRATGWTALPSFLPWLVLMIVIGVYLLGIAHVISGHFSPVEMAMIILVGAASAAGIATFAQLKSALSVAKAASIFAVLLIEQWVSFRLSFLPAIARR